eukprot:373436-Pyramimonas_sp.AAC.1
MDCRCHSRGPVLAPATLLLPACQAGLSISRIEVRLMFRTCPLFSVPHHEGFDLEQEPLLSSHFRARRIC